ncbi:hypothetical protein STEG23_035688 [Scotinomys teguina]
MIFTDGSKTGCGAYVIDSQEPVLHQFSPGAPQKVELAIVAEVFKACSFSFNLISDSLYVVNAVKSLECAGPIKHSSTDRQDPIWVLERLTRKVQHVAASDDVDMDSCHDDVPVVSTREDGTEIGHPSHIPKTNADQP